MQQIINGALICGWLLHYEKAFAEEVFTYKKTMVSFFKLCLFFDMLVNLFAYVESSSF
jgi:hypothetical protein